MKLFSMFALAFVAQASYIFPGNNDLAFGAARKLQVSIGGKTLYCANNSYGDVSDTSCKCADGSTCTDTPPAGRNLDFLYGMGRKLQKPVIIRRAGRKLQIDAYVPGGPRGGRNLDFLYGIGRKLQMDAYVPGGPRGGRNLDFLYGIGRKLQKPVIIRRAGRKLFWPQS